MKFLSLTASLILIVLSFATAHADTELVVTPLDQQGLQWMKQKTLPKGVSRREQVFSVGERTALNALGGSLSAETQVWTLNPKVDAEALRLWIETQGKVGVESRETSFEVKSTSSQTKPSARSLIHEQWALKNTGRSVKIDVDDLSTLLVPGRVGEDIGIEGIGIEKKAEKNVLVAVLDTGVDYTHPDLMDAISIKVDECKADAEFAKCDKITDKTERESCRKQWATVDSDKNGYPRDCAGWNTAEVALDKETGIRGNNRALDLNGHGTHVSGIIAATGKEGTIGVSKNIRILPVKVLTASPEGPVRPQSINQGVDELPSPDERDKKWSAALVDNVARGVLYALRNKVDIINISLGWGQKANSPLLKQMLELATSRNVLVVAAAGNDSTDAMISPCDFDRVICVASHDPNGELSHFSNYGPGIDIAAPGLNILSTWPRSLRARLFTDRRGYNFANGTSQATPYVAGVAGRLLAEGKPAAEIYPRLMLGARQSAMQTAIATNAAEKMVLSGNLNFSGSQNLEAQALILPVSRKVERLPWDRESSTLNLPVRLKNFWKNDEEVSIHFKTKDASFAVLNAEFSFSSWQEAEEKLLNVEVKLADRNVRSDLLLLATIKTSKSERMVPLAFEIYVPVTQGLSDTQVIRSRLDDKIDVSAGSIRSVTGLGEFDKDFEFLQIQSSAQGPQMTVFRFDGNSKIQKMFSQNWKVPMGELLLIQKGRFFSGEPGYTLIYRVRAESPKDPMLIHFLFFDLSGKEMSLPGKTGENSHVLIFDNKRYAINDKFLWMKHEDQYVPMWIGSGYLPELEKPKFDPWNPEPIENRTLRLYYVSPEGVRTVQVEDEELQMLDILLPTAEQKLKGEYQLLLAKGDEYDSEFFTTTVTNGKVGEIQPLVLENFHQLTGLQQFKLTGVDRKLKIEGSTLMGPSYRASQRVTAIAKSKVVLDEILEPTRTIDGIVNLIGTFRGDQTSSAFSQTIYDLQYHDFITGEIHNISSRRFSFLPLSLFAKTMTPMLVKQGNGDFLPAVYSGAGQGLSSSQDIVVPEKKNGKVTGLIRPALLKLEAGPGCRELANVIPATAERPALFPFVCSDEVLFIPAAMD